MPITPRVHVIGTRSGTNRPLFYVKNPLSWLFGNWSTRLDLLDAIEKDDPAQLKTLLDAGVSPNWTVCFSSMVRSPNPESTSPLVRAIGLARPEMVGMLLAAGANTGLRAGPHGERQFEKGDLPWQACFVWKRTQDNTHRLSRIPDTLPLHGEEMLTLLLDAPCPLRPDTALFDAVLASGNTTLLARLMETVDPFRKKRGGCLFDKGSSAQQQVMTAIREKNAMESSVPAPASPSVPASRRRL